MVMPLIIESTKSDDLSDPSSDKVRQILDDTILLIGIHNIQSYNQQWCGFTCTTQRLQYAGKCWSIRAKASHVHAVLACIGQIWSILVSTGRSWSALASVSSRIAATAIHCVANIFPHTLTHSHTCMGKYVCTSGAVIRSAVTNSLSAFIRSFLHI